MTAPWKDTFHLILAKRVHVLVCTGHVTAHVFPLTTHGIFFFTCWHWKQVTGHGTWSRVGHQYWYPGTFYWYFSLSVITKISPNFLIATLLSIFNIIPLSTLSNPPLQAATCQSVTRATLLFFLQTQQIWYPSCYVVVIITTMYTSNILRFQIL